MANTWIDQREPSGSDWADLLAYFGTTPPPDQDQLIGNVGKKRRRWRELAASSTKKVRDTAQRVFERVDDVANAVLKGAPIVAAETLEELEQLEATLVPVDELWEHIEGLLLQGDLDAALLVAKQAQTVYTDSWVPFGAYGWAVQVGYEGGQVINPMVLEDGLKSLESALELNSGDSRVWESACSLLVGLKRFEDVPVTADEASRALSEVPIGITARVALAHLALGQLEEGLKAAVLSVNSAPDDLAIRAMLASSLVDYGSIPMLPLSTRKDVKTYEEVVLTAAWCASGIPDAEIMVRPHLLWAARASTRVFNGNIHLRSILALFTLFLSPFVHTRLRSKPMWKLLLEGPTGETESVFFELILEMPFISEVHAKAPQPFVWAGTLSDDTGS